MAVAAAAVCAAFLGYAAPAGAVGCAGLQTAIDSVPDGGTVTVDQGTCTGMSFTLPSHPSTFTYTLRGAGSGAAFNGAAPATRILAGSDVGNVTLANLTFENSTAPTGDGAVDIGGNSTMTFESDRFFGNTATTAGGAIRVMTTSLSPTVIRNSTFGGTTAGSGNTANQSGGAVSITGNGGVQVAHSVFRGNSTAHSGGGLAAEIGGSVTLTGSTFTQNSSGDSGGAVGFASARATTVLRNVFSGNTIKATANGTRRGGGLWAIAISYPLSMTQSGNRFTGNSVEQDGSRTSFAPGGGGEWVQGYDLTSRNERFTNNSLASAVGSGNEAEGGGLGLEGCGTYHVPTDILRNDVAAGNRISGDGEGAGVYGGSCGGGTVNAIVQDSTIAGNRQGASTGTGGLAGGSSDTLKLRNSIVTANGIGADISGFATRDVKFTDACTSGAPVAGIGNICKPPKLANPGPGHADVHETLKSPTLDAGSNAFIPSGLIKDFEGQPRIQNGRVDMGADEFKDHFGGALIVSKTAKVKNGEARVRVRCPTTAVGHCTGTLRLRLHGQDLGSATFVMTTGTQHTVHVPLSDSAKTALQSGPLRHVTAKAESHDDLGVHKTRTRKIDLKPA